VFRSILLVTSVLVVLLSAAVATAAPGDNVGIEAARRVSEAREYFTRELSSMQQRFGVDLKDALKELFDMEQDGLKKMDGITRNRTAEVRACTHKSRLFDNR